MPKITVFASLLACLLLFQQTSAQQTVRDSMDGNWAVIDGRKIFLSGMNIAWISPTSFGNDVGDTKINIAAFTTHVKNVRKAGGNALRWWLHTDASRDPKIDSTGAVTGLGSMTISNIRQALDTAHAYGVVISMCLFSFDMLVPGDGEGKASYSDYDLESNHQFLTVPANLDTYLNNALKPLLDSVGSHPAIMCWEVFNEPEGMLASANWAHVTRKITMDDILRITNKIAGFVHRNSNKMVSTGIASFQYLPEYSDASLVAAGGDADGYLDFYMAHYYPEWQDASISPFEHPADHWNADRPILIGEFPAKSWSTDEIGPSSGQPLKTSKTITAAFQHAYDNGYAGAMSWALSEQNEFFGSYETTAPALTALFEAHQSDIMIKDVTIEDMSGNHVMALHLENLATPSGGEGYWELGTSFSHDFSEAANLTFDMFVEPGSATNLQIVPVIKVTDSYTWSPADGEAIRLTGVEPGKWITYTIPITAFGAADLTDVREFLFQYWALTTPYASGTLYFDNVRVESDTLGHFDTEGSAWFTGASEASVSLVRHEAINPVENPDGFGPTASGLFDLSVSGRQLHIGLSRQAETQVLFFDLTGAKALTLDLGLLEKGKHFFGLPDIKPGAYVAEVRTGKISPAKLSGNAGKTPGRSSHNLVLVQ